jgi:hypothetical protein
MKSRQGIAIAGQGHPSGYHEICLRQLSSAVEVRYGNASYRARGAIGINLVSLDCETIVALESGVAAAIVVSRGSDCIESEQNGHNREEPHCGRWRRDPQEPLFAVACLLMGVSPTAKAYWASFGSEKMNIISEFDWRCGRRRAQSN